MRQTAPHPEAPTATPPSPTTQPASRHRIIVVGTGFSGLCMGVKLREMGEDDFVLLERAGEVGGTWRDNTYPGCACDVESHLYSFSFEPNPNWSRLYAPQPEIFAYLRHVARKYDLMRHIRFHANLIGARWDEARRLWVVRAEDGRVFEGEVLVSGMGGLSNPAYPDIPGLDRFEGPQFHSATWRHDVDLNDKRVAVIGSGASAIQFVPQIAPKVAHLSYFQRTPPWVVPKMDRPVTPRERADFQANPWRQRIARNKLYWMLEARFLAFKYKPEWMGLVAKVGKHRIRKHIKDPALQAKLTPSYTPGCKRLLISNDYYPALARTNVSVITEGIREVTARGVVTQDGREHPADVIIYGTGFKVQDPIPKGAIFGRGGVDLVDLWREGPEAFLGITVAGFPNFFVLMGPNTGLGHNSMVYMIESQAHYIIEALKVMKERRLRTIEVKPEAQAKFVSHVQQALTGTVWNSGCKSWYLNERGRNTAAWPGFTFAYRLKTRRFRLQPYRTERA
ncbi:NAD(P)-binding domain-containing protein [Aquabacterium fontiphilum]|uniref:flavin-containing monooxygenase n=1 Tax=Aquabacterium fontiphilum TaxID=450365 RepID=UPI001376DA9C|nr:NAD(P)/FAD-dependent oxidoreductase [Aquabacterium fontiphilum]NBD19663.1 NAD(P)-binding domain-containing protein [Aquabacterium fontiphilum]